MMRKLKRLTGQGEEGQSLVLLAFALLVVIGATAMSVDVGRAYWAKTQVQAAVDAAALAGAASLPDTTTAGTQADAYWDLNNNFLESQGSNVTLTKNFDTAGSREITVTGSADIDTWFARVLGINSWHVSATASAEFQKVDAMLVLDRSGSMCYDSHGPAGNFYGLIRLSDGNLSSGSSTQMPNSSSNRQIQVAKHSDVSSMALSNLVYVGQRFKFESSTSAEWMEIVSIDSADKITVKRGVGNPNNSGGSGSSTITTHNAGSNAWARGTSCTQAGKGPFYPWEYIKSGALTFVDNMNSSYDQVGYVDFHSQGYLAQDMTSSFTTVRNAISGQFDPGVVDASRPNGDDEEIYTNIAHGIWYGVNRHLNSPNRRDDTLKVLVLLSDGVPTKYCTNTSNPSNYSTSCTRSDYNTGTSTTKAELAADYAKTKKVVIYTISYGSAADEDLMQYIADTTGGKHYVAPDSATLQTAFEEIAKSTHVKLTN